MNGTYYLNAEAIPEALTALPRWVCLEVIPGIGCRWKKRPTSPTNGYPCDYTSPDNRWAFSDAVSGLGVAGNNALAFVPQKGDDFVFVDLDDCVDESGQIERWAEEVVATLASYTEWSPSRTGLHIICKGRTPARGTKGRQVEIYGFGQPMAVTGDILPGVSTSIEERQDAIDSLWGSIETKSLRKVPSSPIYQPTPRRHQRIPDEEVLSRARAARNGEKFKRLYDEGDWRGYNSQSEADLALTSILLYWCDGDERLADALFRESALFREKWDENHGTDSHGRSLTYGEMTLREAMDGLSTASREGQAGPRGLDSEEKTDLGNAKRLIRHFGDEIRFDAALGKWRYWDGTRWAEDRDGMIYRLFGEVTKRMAQDAKYEPNEDRAAALKKFSLSSQSKSKMEAAITLARHLEGITVQADDLDKDPLLLNLQNGTFDLDVGEFRPARREDYLTKVAGPLYDPGATCPRWERFLEEVFEEDKPLIGFVQRAVGYTLTGLTEERVIFFLHGMGANGKSVFLRVLSALLGDYGVRMPSDSFVMQRASGIPNDIATTKGARLICGSELEPNAALKHALVKQMTGGDDVTARYLFQEHFTFTPTGKIWLATNHLPELNGGDQAIWDRVRVVPFLRRFEKEDQDSQLAERLLQELPGILNWAITGFRGWTQIGLGSTEALEIAVAAYREESDQVGRFVRDCCVREPLASVSAGNLRAAYENWAQREGVHPLSAKAVAERLKGLGFSQGKSGAVRSWKGLRLCFPPLVEEPLAPE